ncbi:dihydrolipoyl dehydrogenase [Alkaliphilus sp. MSJ-5]|uniref:Dihydrolipoyl dehydrogenase n=1 Tax=Alkaliphilus flagellatus TaxID=2841507 RepID=A0ABS6GA09_9FIRM|nr:dihydrolipoyl dehydrogenase [Alkaliphilus flagellatus]MBU5678196.1 dihydrolipoyl dehydrogenase [Alkaliphilus flagellatus]
MAINIVMPKLGLTMSEGTIIKWHKNEGDMVKKGDSLFDVETDKITNTIEAKEEGILAKILIGNGKSAPVTAPVAILADEGEDISSFVKEEKPLEKETKATVHQPETNEDDKKNVVVIGGGPGGYVAAIRAAQLGAQVTLVDKGSLGGTCLNVGCIPTKVLLHTAEIYQEVLHGKDIGIQIEGNVKVDWASLQQRKENIISHLVGGVTGLLAANGVEVVIGTASFIDRHQIKVIKEDGSSVPINGDDFIIASGSEPFIPPIPGVELEGVLDSTAALNLDELPEDIIIVGGGVIGTEFATLFNSFGVKVTVVEMLPYILPPIDREVAAAVQENMIGTGIDIFTSAKVTTIEKDGQKLKVSISLDREDKVVKADKVLMSVGRRGVTRGLNLEAVNIRLDRGTIYVDNSMRTNIEGIYAIGDVTGKNMLAHVASDQGIVAAENIMGIDSAMKYNAIPACVYTKPEIASVGMTEEEAKKKGINYEVGIFPLVNNGKTLIMKEVENTMIKIITDKKYDEIIGVHIYGPRATDLIAEGTLALRLEATVDELITTVHAHPTVGEAMKEAALAVKNIAIHAVNK